MILICNTRPKSHHQTNVEDLPFRPLSHPFLLVLSVPRQCVYKTVCACVCDRVMTTAAGWWITLMRLIPLLLIELLSFFCLSLRRAASGLTVCCRPPRSLQSSQSRASFSANWGAWVCVCVSVWAHMYNYIAVGAINFSLSLWIITDLWDSICWKYKNKTRTNHRTTLDHTNLIYLTNYLTNQSSLWLP